MANFIIWTCIDYHSPWLFRPVGPYELANWLNSNGYTTKVIDFCHRLSTDDIIDITLHHTDSTTIGVGVSTTFWKSNEDDRDAVKIQKPYSEPQWVISARERLERLNPKFKWVIGGANTNFLTFLRFKWDILQGYAEDSLLKYLDEHSAKKTVRIPFDIKNLKSSFIRENSIISTEVLPIEMSRGCQFKCNFCRFSLLGKKKGTYLRDFCFFEQELLENYEKFGITRYIIVDDTVNESEEKITALAEIAQRLPFQLEWIGYNRLDIISSKFYTANILKDSGLKSAYFGIESFNPDASKISGKPKLATHGKYTLLKLNDQWGKDVNYMLSFIIGLGNESVNDIDNTHQWCIDNNVPLWFFHPLSISKSPTLATPSVFDLNYEKYGYKFSNDDVNWTNNYWSFQQAKEKASTLNLLAKQYYYPAAFLLAAIASTTGKSFDYVMNTKLENFFTPESVNQSEIFLKNYVVNMTK